MSLIQKQCFNLFGGQASFSAWETLSGAPGGTNLDGLMGLTTNHASLPWLRKFGPQNRNKQEQPYFYKLKHASRIMTGSLAPVRAYIHIYIYMYIYICKYENVVPPPPDRKYPTSASCETICFYKLLLQR